VIHFITRNLWQSNVPETWRAPLLALTPAELLLLPTSLPIQAEWPESLSGFLEAARTLSIPALPSEAPAEVAAPDNTLALQSGVKGKKVHEIESLAPIIAQTAERVGARTILDLGAGVGHLAQVLHWRYQLDVIAVDSSPHHIAAAKSRADKLDARLQPNQAKLTFVQAHIQVDLSESELSAILPDDSAPVVLIGLHSCGDLSPSILRGFLMSPMVAAVVNVACCYDFVTVETSVEHRDTGGAGNFSINDGKVLGFPMSAHVNAMPQAKLTRSSNQLACQAVHRWPDTPKTHNASRTHFLRAMLQVVLEHDFPECTREDDVQPTPKELHLGKLPLSSWIEYLQAAMSKLQLQTPATAEQLSSEFAQAENNIRVYWALRAVLAPVVESLILIDRVLFLKENGIEDATVQAVWDPSISPRNFCICACKPQVEADNEAMSASAASQMKQTEAEGSEAEAE